ncbi:hypothetical protein M422DRAFT_29013 [Sphaerobolus stellatus SS14]|uniref:Uncharacterized protein n=1 Tax=Sphaerobolus stellatus (strain SS14) TaxID=990650 RepID=A0A0C9VVG6_SPHS4|nr:hypothetical protein M422DRAFT_29013 [Sphaerobolus stellatus SS14]
MVYIGFMLGVAIGLQIALAASHRSNGWRVPNALSATTGFFHYVYTLPGVALAMIIIGIWAWTDMNIKRMQPYIDLAYGDAPASRSLLLDYSAFHPVVVTYKAYKQRHTLVALSSLMVLTGLTLQPLASSFSPSVIRGGVVPLLKYKLWNSLAYPLFHQSTSH